MISNRPEGRFFSPPRAQKTGRKIFYLQSNFFVDIPLAVWFNIRGLSNGGVAQLGERHTGSVEVKSSILSVSTIGYTKRLVFTGRQAFSHFL